MHRSLATIAAGLTDEFDSLVTPREAAVMDRVLTRIERRIEGVDDAVG